MFQEIPKHINSKFFNYPSIVPGSLTAGFMPKPGGPFQVDAIEAWCTENLGAKNAAWTRRSHYFFIAPDTAFVFKLRWC